MNDLKSSIHYSFHNNFLHQITFKRAERAILWRWDYFSDFSTALQWISEEVLPGVFYYLLLLFWSLGLQTVQTCGRCFYSSPGYCLEVTKRILFFRSIATSGKPLILDLPVERYLERLVLALYQYLVLDFIQYSLKLTRFVTVVHCSLNSSNWITIMKTINYLSQELSGLWCGLHRSHCTVWSGQHNTERSLQGKSAISEMNTIKILVHY